MSVNEFHTSIVIVVVIPRSDPDRSSVQFVLDMFKTGRGDVSKTGTVGSTEHDSLVVGKGFGAQKETGNGSESEDSAEESSLDSHGCMLTGR